MSESVNTKAPSPSPILEIRELKSPLRTPMS